jgi:hypothetical protein
MLSFARFLLLSSSVILKGNDSSLKDKGEKDEAIKLGKGF